MQDNSANRRKTLIVSVLLFLVAGGGVFLFFVIQGSNDLTRTGKRNSFSYGEAAREGVSSFFKSVGFVPDEEAKLSQSAIDRNKDRGLPLDNLGIVDPNPDMKDWMAKADQPRASGSASYGGSGAPTAVPRMAGGSMGGVVVGGGGSKSAGSVTRFGEGSGEGATSVSNRTQAAAAGQKDKGTLGALKNARALLGEGLRSGSAMTASSKWNQSFGVGNGGGKSGELAYNKTGLVSLDKIKSGEIADLKLDKKGGLKAAEVSSPVKDEEGTKKALQGDAAVQAAAEEKKKDNEKKEMASALTNAAGDAANNALNSKPGGPSGGGGDSRALTPEGGAAAPKAVMDSINNVTCGAGCSTDKGDKYTDTQRDINCNSGGCTCVFSGTQTNADGTVITYKDTVSYGLDGSVKDLQVEEKPK